MCESSSSILNRLLLSQAELKRSAYLWSKKLNGEPPCSALETLTSISQTRQVLALGGRRRACAVIMLWRGSCCNGRLCFLNEAYTGWSSVMLPLRSYMYLWVFWRWVYILLLQLYTWLWIHVVNCECNFARWLQWYIMDVIMTRAC